MFQSTLENPQVPQNRIQGSIIACDKVEVEFIIRVIVWTVSNQTQSGKLHDLSEKLWSHVPWRFKQHTCLNKTMSYEFESIYQIDCLVTLFQDVFFCDMTAIWGGWLRCKFLFHPFSVLSFLILRYWWQRQWWQKEGDLDDKLTTDSCECDEGRECEIWDVCWS